MNHLLLFGSVGATEVIIVAWSYCCFSEEKRSELMKGIGKGVKRFKDGMKGIEDDIKRQTRRKRKSSGYRDDFLGASGRA